MLDNQTKSPLASRGVWGGLIAAGAGLASLLGYAVSAGDVQDLTEALMGAAAAIGGILSIIGRIKATRRIG